MLERSFWADRPVFVTGHTGFKGGWLVLVLKALGARVSGYALPAPTAPSFYECAGVSAQLEHETIADIRDRNTLGLALRATEPSIVFHLAAQAIVSESWRDPITTYETNVIGTATVLDELSKLKSVQATVSITSDKCYEPNGGRAHRESDPLGGKDPYSASKACQEIVSHSYGRLNRRVATARAGNVIGGGDWAPDRLLADLMRAKLGDSQVAIRNPNAIRPWQHVLNAVYGYLLLAERLVEWPECADGWNFGPPGNEELTVQDICSMVDERWEGATGNVLTPSFPDQSSETPTLRLDSTKAREQLDWTPGWNLTTSLDATVAWYRAYGEGEEMRPFSIEQVESYVREHSK